MSSRERVISISCEDEQLMGVLHLPAGEPTAAGVLIIVGGPQYRVGSHRQFTVLARLLALQGHAVLRFDQRGMGDSDGVHPGFDHVEPDIEAAIRALLAAVPQLQSVVLWGLCDGASAALLSSAVHPKIRGLVLVNPWVHTAQGEARAIMRHYYLQRVLQRSFWRKIFTGHLNLLRSLREFFGTARQAQRDQQAKTGETDDFRSRMLGAADSFRGSMLVLVSGQDLTAAEFSDLCDSSPEWGAAFRSERAVWQYFPEADHTFSEQDDLQDAARVTAQWLAGNQRLQD